MSDVILFAENIEKNYEKGNDSLKVLKGIDLKVHQGEALSILGPSGAGKSTLLHILGTLEKPTKGEVWYNGKALFQQSEKQQASFRNEAMGFVFQFHYLIKELTAIENVMIPGRIAGWSYQKAYSKAFELLQILDMSSRKEHFPTQLSGGEQQRVAVARALLCSPEVLLADEPTGNLDIENSLRLRDILFSLREKLGLTMIVVTHDKSFASSFHRQIYMEDGLWKAPE